MKSILIVDDDVHIGDMLEEILKREGYGVMRAYSGTEAQLLLTASTSPKPDLILLDLMLPGLSGEDLLPQIRAIPTIVVSAKTDMENKVKLLLDGAADYVTKPFEIRELLARIAVALRRDQQSSSKLSYGEIELDTEQRIASAEGKEIRLTRTESAILKLLIQNAGQVVSKSHLLEDISVDTPDCTESSLKIHVSNLRKKLRTVCDKIQVEAVWGIGFILKSE